MICPESIASTNTENSKSFINWAKSIRFSTTQSFRPTTRGEIVEIIRQAEEQNQRIKWAGSLWSFTESFVSSEIYIESDSISGQITNDVILDRLTLTTDAEELKDEGLLLHVKGGTKVFNVNRILHGLPAAANGGGPDELNLNCDADNKAMLTLGGSGGQSVAGLVATGSHGGDVALRPIADVIVAIHLIGPGGQEWWIEKSSGLTAGTEADTQAEFTAMASSSPDVGAEVCEHIIVRKDDDFFNSVVVSVGRMGFTYAFVFQATNAFKLRETRASQLWETFRGSLSAVNFDDFIGETAPHFLNVLINPFRTREGHECKVTVRRRVGCSTENIGMDDAGGPDVMSLFCGMQDARAILLVLIPTLAVLVGVSIGLAALAGVLVAIPIIGWALAAATYAALAAVTVVITALTGLIGYLTISGSLTSGDLIASIMNFAFRVGLKDLMTTLLTSIFDSLYPLESKTGVSWKIMDTYGYGSEDFCQKVDSMEFAFDVADTTNGGYIAFIDSVFDIFDDMFNRNVAVAGLLALRYTENTSAKLGMSKFPATCHVEIPILKSFEGNAEFLRRVQQSAIAFRGVPHWGQIMSEYDGFNIRDLHQDDLVTWRQTLTELIRTGAGEDFTFSNLFTATYNLEPWEDVAIESITVVVTVGDDPLGDTDWLRHDVSPDFLFVRIAGAATAEVSLNEGTTWNAHSVHTRTITLPAGTMWGDIRAVGIRHVAAGNDWNADNWTMNGIVISTTSVAGVDRERLNAVGSPIWQFQKNARQVWEQTF